MRRTNLILGLLLLATLAPAGCQKHKNPAAGEAELKMKAQRDKLAEADRKAAASNSSASAGGLRITDLVIGKGRAPKRGETCVVHYTGKLLDGKVFDTWK